MLRKVIMKPTMKPSTKPASLEVFPVSIGKKTKPNMIPKTGNTHPYNGKPVEHGLGMNTTHKHEKRSKMCVRPKQWYGEKKEEEQISSIEQEEG